jgi:Uma2 family endonuclease
MSVRPNAPELTERDYYNLPEGAPDFVAEIVSPSSLVDLHTKKAVYACQGVTEYWTLDPETKEILMYRFEVNANDPVARMRSPGKIISPLFPRLSIDLDNLFRPIV